MAILEVMGLVETSDEEPTLTVDGVEGDQMQDITLLTSLGHKWMCCALNGLCTCMSSLY